MHGMNPEWNIPFGPRFGGPRGRGGRGGPHRRPPFGFGQQGPDVEVNVNIDSEDDGPRRHRGRGFGPGGPGGPGFGGRGFGPGGPGGPGFGGRGFGPGGRGPGGRGFGPGGPGGPGGRGRGRRGRGDVRLAVLALVAEQPRHGYEIIQEIAERSGGSWKPSPGSVYPTLSQLEDEGLVRVEQTDGRRVVHLTDAGTTYVAEHREELDKVWSSFEADGEAGPKVALLQELGQLWAAAQQVAGAGTDEQVATATAAVTEARKAIYRLLAE